MSSESLQQLRKCQDILEYLEYSELRKHQIPQNLAHSLVLRCTSCHLNLALKISENILYQMNKLMQQEICYPKSWVSHTD